MYLHASSLEHIRVGLVFSGILKFDLKMIKLDCYIA